MKNLSRLGAALVAAGLLFLGGSRAGAVDPAARCRFQKLGIAGRYAACRLRAEAKALKRGGQPYFSTCDSQFGHKWRRAEAQADGECPSSGDEAAIQSAIAECMSQVALNLSGITTTTTTSSTTSTTLGGVCPTRLQLEAGGDGSDFDMGWTGLGHDQHFTNGALLAVGVSSCQGGSQPCGQCDVSGPVPNAIGPNNQRCTSDTSVQCTADSDCTVAGGTCEFALGQPLPIFAGGLPLCLQGYVGGSVGGTVNLDSGALTVDLPVTWELFLPVLTIYQPCPKCVGDPTPDDGVKGGTCDGGDQNGQACDAGATHFFSAPGRTSLDCPPAAIGRLGTMNTGPFTLSTGAQAVSLSSASPNCRASGYGGFKCLCDTCATLNAEPCLSDADCPGLATCGGKRCITGSNNGDPCVAASDCPGGFCGVPGEPTKPNTCNGGAADCIFNGADTDSVDEGKCSSGPLASYCNIEPFRGCLANSDCPAPGDSCNLLSVARECFTTDGTTTGDTDVQVAGAPDVPAGGVWNPTVGALFCMPPVESSSTNAVFGLPGPGRITLPVTVTEIP